MTTAFLDATVFIYAVGADHPLRTPCSTLIRAAAEGDIGAETSALVVQEVLHQRARRTGDRAHAVEWASHIPAICYVHDLRSDDLDRATQFFAAHAELDAADAAHAAVAENRSCDVLISADRAFSSLTSNVRVMQPVAAVAALVS
jgi:predicted nucleic acid-binding protein